MTSHGRDRRRTRRVAAGLGALAFAALAGGANAGCHDLVVHTFVGQKYDPTGQCLLPKSVIDVIEGEAHGTCEGVRCYAGEDGAVYVSAACEAPPGYTDQTDDRYDRQCRLALEAYDLGADGACPTA